MNTLKPGALPVWDGMVGDCAICRGRFQLTHEDEVKYVDVLLDDRSSYPSPVFACPTPGCLGNVHFRPDVASEVTRR